MMTPLAVKALLLSCVLGVSLPALHAEDAPALVYPSDSFARPTVDAIPVFETFCGVSPAVSSPVERAGKFAVHSLGQIDWHGKKATEWTFQAKPDVAPPAQISLDERYARAPRKAAVTIENRGSSKIEVVCQLAEIGWWTDPAIKPKSTVAVGSPTLQPGETRKVEFAFDAEALRPPLSMAFFLRDPNRTDLYKLVLSELVVTYPAETGVTKAQLAFTSPVQAGKPADITITGKGFDARSQIDVQCSEGRWTLWRIRLDQAEKDALAKVGTVKIQRTVPWYLPPKSLATAIVTPRGLVDGAGASFEVVNAQHPDLPQAKRELVGGVPTFTRNGVPVPWSGYSSFDFQPGNVEEFGRKGANMFLLATNAGRHIHNVSRPTWNDDGTYDFKELDELATMSLGANSQANLVIRVSLGLPPSWYALHPETRVIVRDKGKDYVWEESGGVMASLNSEAWKAQQAANLRELIAYVRKQPWADRVVAFLLVGGVTEEWFNWGSNNQECADYSAPQQEAFAAWCQAKKFPWKKIPSPEDRMITGTAFYPDTEAGRCAAAYQQFISETTARTISHFAKVVKEATADRSLTGAYYGYTIQLAGEPRQSLSGHFGVRELLDDPNLDFLAGIPLHDYRKNLAAAYHVEAGMNASIQSAGKGYIDENDMFSWLHPGPWHTLFNEKDPRAGAISMHQRVLSGDVINGNAYHWYSLLSNWHHDDALQTEFSLHHKIQADSLRWNRSPRNGIAFVVDDTSMAWITPKTNYLQFSNIQGLYAAARTGASVGAYLLSDVDKIPESVKMIVVAYAVAPKPPALAKLKEVIARGGRTIVVVGPAGLIDADTQKWDDQGPATLTGLPVTVHRDTAKGQLELADGHQRIVDVGPVSPYTTVEGKGWANYFSADVKQRPSAGAERPLANNGRLIWSALPVVDPLLTRHWAETAGVHLYAPLDCTVHASEDAVSVTAPREGTYTLRWPAATKVKDLFDGSIYEGQSFDVPFQLGQTRLFVKQP